MHNRFVFVCFRQRIPRQHSNQKLNLNINNNQCIKKSFQFVQFVVCDFKNKKKEKKIAINYVTFTFIENDCATVAIIIVCCVYKQRLYATKLRLLSSFNMRVLFISNNHFLLVASFSLSCLLLFSCGYALPISRFTHGIKEKKKEYCLYNILCAYPFLCWENCSMPKEK